MREHRLLGLSEMDQAQYGLSLLITTKNSGKIQKQLPEDSEK